MAKVQILSDIVINQIAAGEVVERPAAVVKELIENSIDSGANNIIARFSHGGKYSIIVEDNGCGMNTEDALLAFERHATSKISTLEDINDIHTFGFRGEALPSIASVSKFTLRTRTSDTSSGTEIIFNGGKLVHAKECGTTPGTIIQVEQLFYNTPARRLFLKTDQTEANLIISLVKNFALAEREINFELYSETKKIFSSPIHQEWTNRINEIFLNKERLLPVNFENKECKIEGAICDPKSGNLCKKFFSFFVNRRPVDSKLLRFAVNDILAPILPNYREVITCLLITINPRFIDVNVHPTKREIKFRNEQFIKNSISNALQNALSINTSSIIPETGFKNQKYFTYKPSGSTILKDFDNITKLSPSLPKSNIQNKQIFHETRDWVSQLDSGKHINTDDWKFIGNIFENCAIFENISGMIILNLKLAITKIIYEKLKTDTQSKNVQALLFPISFTTSFEESQVLDKLVDFLLLKGIEIYQSGKNQYRITGIPEWINNTDVENMIQELISAATQYDFTKNTDINKKQFASLASKYAKYKHKTTEKEIQDLLYELLLCENCSLCPNGYSTFFELPKCDFIKRFGRL